MDIVDPTNVVPWLVVAVALVGSAGIWLAVDTSQGGLDLRWPMGSPAWDFTQSWASNITVGAAVLAVAISSFIGGQARTDEFVRPYMTLSVFYVALSAAAPCLYNAWRHGKVGADGKVGYQGYVGMFLLSAVLTTWAAYGQLATLWALATEATPSRLAPSMLTAMHAVIGGIAAAFVPFVVQTIYWVVRSQHAQASSNAFTESVTGQAAWPLL